MIYSLDCNQRAKPLDPPSTAYEINLLILDILCSLACTYRLGPKREHILTACDLVRLA
jgi:hypothetical protein|uniref:Uncharacterized protein n=2 Tax=Picea TaxID=3328 RepID=A0A117NGM6_PICGL|nr:hypothetical protein ABT39_MTgene6051 [Picea glauca]QHR91441.1 hypothetical protein Q903MT_gene5475 [Picea sitchensis]